MAKHVVAEAILGEDIGDEIAFVGEPVVGELLRAEDQDGLVAQLVVFDDGEGGEGFSQADAICEDTAVKGFQFVNDAGSGVALEVEELLPDEAVLVAGAIIGQEIGADVFQELAENIIEHQEVDALGRVLLIDRCDVVAEAGGDVFQFLRVVPDLVEQLHIGFGYGLVVEFVYEVRNGIALFVTEIDGGEAVDRHINRLAGVGDDRSKLLHSGITAVGAKDRFLSHPIGAFLGNGPLC